MLTRHASIGDGSPAVPITVITGMPGIGKTTLAARWAQQAAGQFPDGQLYLDLRGYGPDPPMTPADALAGLLRELGAGERDIPEGTAERTVLYRSLIAGRRVLVVLDNATSAEQVRPLLPATPGCTVLVTSRDSLAGLVAKDGAARLDLGLLSLADATSMLRTLIGERVDSDPRSAADLAAHCARLPLALRLAAELVVARKAEPLQGLARELADSYGRLELADAGSDPGAAMRAAFSWSFQYLDSETAEVFRLLGLHPAGEFGSDAVAAMGCLTSRDAAARLTALARAHLVYATGADRYGMHDLLRAFAAEQVHQHETPAGRRGARARLFDYYLITAAAAADALYPASRRRVAARIAIPPGAVTRNLGPERALEWLDAQRATLIKIIYYTADNGWPAQSIQLASALFRYLESSGYFTDIASVYDVAARAASSCGDYAGQAEALSNLSVVDLRQGRYTEATALLEQALALHRQIGDIDGQAHALGNLGIVETELGSYAAAAAHQERALALYRQIDGQAGAARTLGNLGVLHYEQGRCGEAVSYFRQSLELAQRLGITRLQASALDGLAHARSREGRYAEAIGHCEHALVLFLELGDPVGQADVLNAMGEALLSSGQLERARIQHAAALALASDIDYKPERARSHHYLGRALHALSRHGEAREHWRRAAVLYAELGAPQEADVRALLLGPD
jgi:tetratricopeptide (TPR) repeat protein